ncbi:MAG: hypothetical protein ABIT96_08820 [Ferruginibacter sp.]
MNNKNKISGIIFTIYIFLSFYVFGGGVVNSLVAYKTWRMVGAEEFPKFHQVDSAFIIPLFVIFFFLSFIPQILLIWYRPIAVPRYLVFVALLFNLITLISTITVQIPIQVKLDQAFSAELIEKLISTDLIWRKIPMLFLAITNFSMLYMVVKRANR